MEKVNKTEFTSTATNVEPTTTESSTRQLLGAVGLTAESFQELIFMTCRFTIIFLVIRVGIYLKTEFTYKYHSGRKLNYGKLIDGTFRALVTYCALVAYMMYSEQKIIDKSFPAILISFVVVYMLMIILRRIYAQARNSPPPVTYGTGMACSYFEGYLSYIIPSDGAKFIGFQENINMFEASQGVVFPVRRLMIIITHSLYCPPDLRDFNKQNRPDLPYLEALTSLDDVLKDVAGVKNRVYRNSAYAIYRPGGKPPVLVCAEFATPLHTLHRALDRRAVYDKLCDVDVDKVVAEFCEQLRDVIERTDNTRDKCEIVYYNDTDPNENLAEVLLKKVAELEPDFEEVIARKQEEERKQF